MQFIDDNYSYLGCCRKDKKCNVYLLALFKHFFVLKETWSNWLTFRTYSTGIIPPETNGQAVTNIKIKYTDNSGIENGLRGINRELSAILTSKIGGEEGKLSSALLLGNKSLLSSQTKRDFTRV